MRVYVDVDLDDVLEEMTDYELMQEVERRKISVIEDLTEEVQQLYDAIYIRDEVGANAALSNLIEKSIDRILNNTIKIV